jgi:hypothetical protein
MTLYHFIAAPADDTKQLTVQKLKSKINSPPNDVADIYPFNIPDFKVIFIAFFLHFLSHRYKLRTFFARIYFDYNQRHQKSLIFYNFPFFSFFSFSQSLCYIIRTLLFLLNTFSFLSFSFSSSAISPRLCNNADRLEHWTA